MNTTPRQEAIAALRPFAEIADVLDANDRDPLARPGVVLLSIGDAAITTDDVRHARAALETLTKSAKRA